jgi:sister chromatid cohesion protein DCC1
VDRESTSPSVQALHEENLSTNLPDRLRFLFKTKEKWSAEQIQPYIEYFTSPQLAVSAILAKHARSLMINGKRYYVSKH